MSEHAEWQALLDELRWEEDMCVTDPFGDPVWLKPYVVDGKRIGITECCLGGDPCVRHGGTESDGYSRADPLEKARRLRDAIKRPLGNEMSKEWQEALYRMAEELVASLRTEESP